MGCFGRWLEDPDLQEQERCDKGSEMCSKFAASGWATG
jgi:hypothetical protein